MDRLERVVVQLVEARRLADFNDDCHGRLALLLLDDAAETLLRDRAKQVLAVASWHGNALKGFADIGGVDNEALRTLREQLKDRSVPEKAREVIEKNFAQLVTFVFDRFDGDMPQEFADGLTALHRHRIDAHRRTDVRVEVLGPAVEIYFYLCCHLLKNQRFLLTSAGAPPAVVVDLLPDGALDGVSPDEVTLGGVVADYLLEQHQLDRGGVESLLASHLLARIDAIEGELDAFIDYRMIADTASALRSVELLPLTEESPAAPEGSAPRPPTVTEDVLREWRHGGAEIAKLPSARDALRRFCEIERATASFERQLEPFISAIALEMEHDIDENGLSR